jgi:hypothetical protein
VNSEPQRTCKEYRFQIDADFETTSAAGTVGACNDDNDDDVNCGISLLSAIVDVISDVGDDGCVRAPMPVDGDNADDVDS